MDIFTDWCKNDPHYFYSQGAMWGAIVTLLIIWLIKQLYNYWKEHK
jgi:hypothetical protein